MRHTARICLISLVLIAMIALTTCNFWSDKLAQTKHFIEKNKKPFLDNTKDLLSKVNKERPHVIEALKKGSKIALKGVKRAAKSVDEFVTENFDHKKAQSKAVNIVDQFKEQTPKVVSSVATETKHFAKGIKKTKVVKKEENCETVE